MRSFWPTFLFASFTCIQRITCEHSRSYTFNVSEDNTALTGFNWTALRANTYLDYTPCYDGFECARLEVPLDWNNVSSSYKVQLAIIRLPASVPETDPSFGGTILINPGGPGGSGIDVMRWTGYGIRDVVDSDKHFELLSWDPRGMQHTSPVISCFKSSWQRDIWTYRYNVIGPMDASNASLIQKWALGRSLGQLCEQTNLGAFPDGSNMAQFSTTLLVVQDMVEIVDQIEIHRSKVVQETSGSHMQISLDSEGPALLNFWGYSYGSYLGNTFASMFPSRIGRMILDSVVDADDYTATGWFSNLLDHHKALDYFYRDCFDAGALCPLAGFGISSPVDIASKVNELLRQLKSNPIIVLHDDTPDIVTWSDVSSLLLSTMYFPNWTWPELAQILADLSLGDGTSISRYLQSVKSLRMEIDKDDLGHQLLLGKNKTVPYPPAYLSEAEAARAVLCGDGDDLTHLTMDDWYRRSEQWRSQSPIAGWRWSENPMMCAHWPKSWRPAKHHRFTGPWISRLADYDHRGSPLLFVGGTADPVLPLKNAYKAAARHEGAHVLVQEGPGHCTGYINPNLCTWGHIKRFFAHGVLPGNNTICERDRTPWSNLQS